MKLVTQYLTDVSTHSRPKAAGSDYDGATWVMIVSTHSRLKAAGPQENHRQRFHRSFNTQPPEGGWESAEFDV